MKYLIPIELKLYTPSDKLYIIVISNHSITLFGNYIFNSQNNYALIRSKSNFIYIFGSNFSLDYAIKFEFNKRTEKIMS